MATVSLEDARRLKPEVAEAFGAYGPIAAIGLTRAASGSYAVKINYASLKRPLAEVPRNFKGVPIVCVVTGPVRALGVRRA